MEFRLLTIFTFLSLLLVASHANAALSPQAYWKTALPSTPMPKAVKVLVPHGDSANASPNKIPFPIYINVTVFLFSYSYGTTIKFPPFAKQGVDVFFLESNLTKPKNMTLDFSSSLGTTILLPRDEAQKIPFSSQKFQEILDRFSVRPDSKEAEVLRESIARCEEPGVAGEEKYCATSLESMIDFVTSKLGKDVVAVSTDVERQTRRQVYSIIGIRDLPANEIVVCHKLNYAYVVYNCHSTSTTGAYNVSMVGVDGTRVQATAVCHTDTSAWNPNHLAFQVLKVKPGSGPICHFLPEGHVLWVPK